MNKDNLIKSILEKYGEGLSATWLVQGQRVIYHAALERIAAKAGVRWLDPVFLISTPEHAVLMASGKIEEQYEWSIGEAQIGVNYRVIGKQVAYPFAMAEKRAKDRVILKLIQLHGLVYSEEEADEFKRAPEVGSPNFYREEDLAEIETQASPKEARRAIMFDAISSGKPIALDDGVVHPGEALKRLVREQGTVQGVVDLMRKYEVQTYLSGIPEDQYHELKDFAKSRMVDLGWGKRDA